MVTQALRHAKKICFDKVLKSIGFTGNAVAEEIIKVVDSSQVDECVGTAIEIMQLPPDMSDDLYSVLTNWLDENGYDITDEP